MSVLDRIVSFLGGIVVFVSAIILLILASPYHNLLEYYWTSIFRFLGVVELALIGIIFLLIAIRMLWLTFKREKGINSVSKEMELGELKIAVEAIENMVMQVAGDIRGVTDIKTKIKPGDEGISIYFRGKVAPDVAIPPLSERLQREIKEYIETVSGIAVKEIKVLIENITEGKGKKFTPPARTPVSSDDLTSQQSKVVSEHSRENDVGEIYRQEDEVFERENEKFENEDYYKNDLDRQNEAEKAEEPEEPEEAEEDDDEDKKE